MVGVFSWNDVDVLFTFNFDLDLILTFSHGDTDLDFVTSFFDGNYMCFVLRTSHIEPIQLNLHHGKNVCLECICFSSSILTLTVN